jgi:hypothetical protein
MGFIRKLFLLLTAAMLAWLGIYTYNQVTDGFSIWQISSSLPAYPQYEASIDGAQKEYLQQIFDQKFHYIGKGCQFYVFESEDGKYVIKFLKHKHLRPFSWLNALPMPPKWRAVCDEKIARRKMRVERLFASCKLAYEKMSGETGLLFIHLNRTVTLEKEVTLIDKMGLKHTIAVDEFEYVLQKKGIPLKEVFATLDKQAVAKKVEQLLALVVARCEKGISDRDRSFVQNVAFAAEDQRAIFVDVGQFYEEPLLLQKEEQAKELDKRLNNLRYWTERHFPDLLPYINVHM